MRQSLVRRTLMVVGTGLLLTIAPDPGAATASPAVPDRDPPASADPMRQQDKQRQAAEVINRLTVTGRFPGYVNLGFEQDGVVLWWHGELPAPVRAAVAAAERTAPVRVRQARYSRTELETAAERIGAAMEASPEGDVRGVSVLGDGSSIRVRKVPAGSGTARAGATVLPAVGVPVTVVEEEPPTFMTRLDDGEPWWGGARIEAWRNGRRRSECTSGWGVHNGRGAEWLLTAAHCGTAPDEFRDPTGQHIGTVSSEVWQRDIMLVRTNAEGRIYDGPVNGAWVRDVKGWADPFAGQSICQSGSTSGTVCGLVVSNEFNYRLCGTDSDGDWTCMSGLVLANKSDGGTAARGGDSGGPVYFTGGSGVMALGTVTGAGGSRLLFQDFREAAANFGVAPLTYP